MEVKQLQINIDGVSHLLPLHLNNTVVIEVCANLGIDIPRFCYHENLAVAGNCRMCLIEDVKAVKPVVCCAMQVGDGLTLFTNSLKVKKARESVLEFLLINHPLDCPICDQGGECDLQDLTLVYGADRGRFYEYKRNVEDKNCGPIVKTTMNRCILCTRCVRFANDVAGFTSFGLTGRGMKMEIGSYVEKLLTTDLSGNLVDICPVGALTSKPYSFMARSWEVKRRYTLNVYDDEIQILRADVKDNEILRLLPAKNMQSETWLTDRTRFLHESITRQRIINPSIKGLTVGWSQFINSVVTLLGSGVSLLTKANSSSLSQTATIAGYTGGSVDVRSILVLKQLINSLGSSYLYSDQKTVFNLLSGAPNQISFLNKDLLVLLDIDLPWEAPIFNLVVKRNPELTIINWRSFINNTISENVLSLGDSLVSLNGVVRGQNWFSTYIISQFKTPLIVTNGQSKEGIFLSGWVRSGLSEILDIDIYNVLVGSTSRALSVIGFSEKLQTHQQNLNMTEVLFSYNSGFDQTAYKWSQGGNEYGLRLYQGHHGDIGASKADFVAPSHLFFENQLTLNYSSDYKVIKALNPVTPPSNTRSDYHIINTFFQIAGGISPNFDLIKNYDVQKRFLVPRITRVLDFMFPYRHQNSSWASYYTATVLVRNAYTLQQIPVEHTWFSIYK